MSGEAGRGENAFIRRLRKELRRADAAEPSPAPEATAPRDFIDDMAALPAASGPLLWTVDMLMDGVDFQSGRHGWYQIGRKAMAANLSDCAAMAVRPLAALCAVALNERISIDDAVDLVRGAHEFGLRFGCPVVGGDTNSWEAPTAISISVAACPEAGQRPVRRDGAQPGDQICLSGSVGGSILGRHLTFEPRIELALTINRQLKPHAMIDISDGLAIDLGRVLEASGCGATLDDDALDALIHPDAVRLAQQDGVPPREHALQDGEDFELIVVLPKAVDPQELQPLGLRVIGRIHAESGLWLQAADGSRAAIAPRGWEHLR